MNKKIKTLWLKALKSGEYKHGQGELKTLYNKFCCLGVLCDLYAKQHKISWTKNRQGKFKFLRNSDYLPKKVAIWAGISCSRNLKSTQTKLSGINDDWATCSYKKPIKEIEKL